MEILALKWNNHQTVFSHQISEFRRKTVYTDATLACHGKFFQVHRLVLSTCSEYFSAIFNQTPCKNPVIVLKDISCKDLEFLLDYMYVGEVNVRQNELSSLIGAAENLQIKGLAVSDEEFNSSDEHKSSSKRNNELPERSDKYDVAKRQKTQAFTPFGDSNEDTSIQKSSTTGNKNQTAKTKEILNSFCTSKKFQDRLNTDVNNVAQKENQQLYTTEIKAEPETELPLSNYESDMKDEPCTSNVEEITCSEENSSLNYQFFSDDLEFPDNVSDTNSSYKEKSLNALPSIDRSETIFQTALQNKKDSLQPMGLVSPILQDDTCSQLSLDSHDLLAQGPFLQLPLSGVMGRGPRTNLERRGGDKGGGTRLIKRDYVCSFCGRTFSHRTNQLAHERIHTGEKPFRCLYCPFRTALKGNLKNHIFSRHHGDWKAIKHLIFPSKDS